MATTSNSHDLRIACWTLGVALVLFAILAVFATGKETPEIDRWVVTSLRNPADLSDPIGPYQVEEAARDITALGGFTVLIMVTIAVAAFLAFIGKYRAMAFVLVATIGGTLLSAGLKFIFSRPRPDFVPHLTQVSLASFPSGHSMMSAVVYLTLGSLLMRLVKSKWLQTYFLLLAVLLVILVGCSRVYLGVHYPTDVAAGWMAGLSWACLCWLVARSLQKQGQVEQSIDTEEA